MNRENVGKRKKYSDAIILSVGILSQQGANFLPKRLPSRIALFQITIHSWIMYNYYSASIVSARLSEPLDMMEDSVTVLADSNLKIAAEAVPYLNYFLYNLNWESDYFRKKRWDPLPESKRYLPIEEGIKQVGQGILAYHTDPNTAYPYVERMFDSNKICELTEIHLFKQSVMGMYASHNGQFIEIAKIGLTKMFNTGLRNRQIKYWSSRKPECQLDTLSTRSITIYEIAPALILLAFGIIVANDYQILKLLNEVGIGVSITQFTSIINIPQFLHTTYWNLGIFVDLECLVSDEDIVKLFYETSAYYMFDHLHQWLILEKNMNHILQLLNDNMFSIITDVTIAISKDDDYILYDVYNHCKNYGGLLNITKLGTWTKNDGLQIILQTNKFSRRWNYHRMKIKVAGVVVNRPKNQSLIDYLQEENLYEHTDNWSKFGYAIMEHVKQLFNFTNGPLIAGFKNGIYDLGYFPSILTKERFNYADVIMQVWPIRTCFMFLTVPSLKVDMNIIFRPFARNVWYMILILTVIIIFGLWIILKLEKNDSAYGSTILIIIAALCQQAAIVSSRLNAPLDKMNDSLYSLINSRMKLAAYKDIYFNILLHSSVEEIQYFKKYWEKIPEEKKFFSIQDGLKKMTTAKFAYHTDPINVYPFIERVFDKQMICQLTEVHLLRPSSLGLWSMRHSQFQEITKIGLIRISTSGIRKREVIRWTYRKPYCDKDKHYVSSVTIHETIPILLVLCFGIILSIVICFIENIIFHTIRKKQRQIKESEHQLKKNNQKNVAKNKTMIKIKKLMYKKTHNKKN
ncbi:hypothetical protein APICC_09986 [Apis cerana cerana]|uniref:Ionotropic receptor 75a N-terminal domain-containing protein n=1 Tax=Apis cerana cerana TaxID=94128 RepID=A0A2A3ECS0_APICC|nr:hypothetical protein APICC_09986 [Apis cerana cerana]